LDGSQPAKEYQCSGRGRNTASRVSESLRKKRLTKALAEQHTSNIGGGNVKSLRSFLRGMGDENASAPAERLCALGLKQKRPQQWFQQAQQRQRKSSAGTLQEKTVVALLNRVRVESYRRGSCRGQLRGRVGEGNEYRISKSKVSSYENNCKKLGEWGEP